MNRLATIIAYAALAASLALGFAVTVHAQSGLSQGAFVSHVSRL